MRMMSENTSRKMDSLGRVSIPKSVRDRLSLKAEDILDISYWNMRAKLLYAFVTRSKKMRGMPPRLRYWKN